MDRRNFIKNLGILSGAGTISLSIGGIPIKAFARPFLNIKTTNGKVLVLLQLNGGNDGLNTIIPYEDSIYYSKRPILGVPKNSVVPLNSITGLHPSLLPLKELYDNGKVTIVQNVGYENPNRSHFRATDIWLSASDSNQFVYDGWAGRYLKKVFPDYPSIIPEHPMAIQLGAVQSLLLESQHGSMGVAFDDPNQFYQLVLGSKADNDPPPNTIAGEELKFLKQVAAASIQYATIIKEKADASRNLVTYPNTRLGQQLAIVAELISGGLDTPVYLTSLGGFDTHANQSGTHQNLLGQVATAISAFQLDLELHGIADRVILMTFSEFGRRLSENGSAGTDHGTAAPIFVIGKSVIGGIIGNNANLTDLDSAGDIKYVYDYRQLYASILKDHLGVPAANIEQILFRKFETLPIINNPTTGVKNDQPISFELKQNYPNPFNSTTRIDYSIVNPRNVSLNVFDNLGRHVLTLINKYQNAGSYSVTFHANELPSGIYIYRLQADSFNLTRKMILTK
jgi:uncharacterized protein (DUF1501 family)